MQNLTMSFYSINNSYIRPPCNIFWTRLICFLCEVQVSLFLVQMVEICVSCGLNPQKIEEKKNHFPNICVGWVNIINFITIKINEQENI